MSKIEKVRLTNFRNQKLKNIKFDESLTLVVGDNAKGKTNLLEGLWMLVGGRSFRARRDEEMIREGQDIARVEGWEGENSLEVLIVVVKR